MTAKPKENPLYGKFDEVVEALVRSPAPDEGAKVEEGQPASPPARRRKPKDLC